MKTSSFLVRLLGRVSPVLVALAALTNAAHAGNFVVVPNSLAAVEGGSGNSYPFNIGTNTMRYQQVYAASEFGAMPAGGAFITGIVFRRDGGWGPFSATLPAIQINLSTTTSAPDGLSATFASNVGPNDTVVFSGPLSLSSTASGSPAAFDVLIPLSTPFFYNPATGNLLLEVRNSGGGTSSQFDAVSVTNDAVSRASNPVNFTTGGRDTLGLITEFVFQSQSTPPVIVNQPQSQKVPCGTNVTFSVGATGLAQLAYQWRRNGHVLAGFTIQDLTLSNVDVTFSGLYDVVVSNVYGSVTSAPAALTVQDTTRYSLQVALQGTNVILSWPTTCASYVLQEASNLNASAEWKTIPIPPILAGGSQQVTLPLASLPRFYRLNGGDLLADSSFGGYWTDNGPALAGRLSAIVVTPTNLDTILVASPGGGVWRTRNSGASWSLPVNYALGDFTVVHLEWDHIRSGRLYASTWSDLYASTDLGDHWSNLTHFGGYPAPLMTGDHSSDPKPFAQLRYSSSESTVFWSKPCLGLYYSYDGSTFIQHWPFVGGAGNPDNCILSIAADDATGYVYFSTMNRVPFGPARLFRSACPWTATTPCLSWVSANSGLPNNGIVAAITYGGSANVLAAAVDPGGSPVVYTTTTGTAWTATPTPLPNPIWDPRPMVSPAPNQLLLGAVVAYETHDWGSTWNQVWYAGMHPDVRGIYWAGFPSGDFLWLTTDGSASSGTYAAISRFNFTPGFAPTGGTTLPLNGMRNWQCYYKAATGVSGGPRRRVFLGSQDNGCLCSDDGSTWTTAGTPPGGCGDYPSLVFAPSNPSRAYARTCDGGAFARSDVAYISVSCAAVAWTNITTTPPNYLPDLWTDAMTAVDPLNADHVCFANDRDVSISSDGGISFTHHVLPFNARPVCVFYDGSGNLYVGTLDHGVCSSPNDGVFWFDFALTSSSPKAIMKIAHSSAGGGEGTFFLATTSGLYRKLPGGDWTRQTPDPSYTASDVEVDPNNPNRICVALGFIGNLGQHRGGVLLSTDNGSSFTSLTSGLDIHQAPIADVQFDPVDSRMIHAAVYGLGAWTYFAP